MKILRNAVLAISLGVSAMPASARNNAHDAARRMNAYKDWCIWGDVSNEQYSQLDQLADLLEHRATAQQFDRLLQMFNDVKDSKIPAINFCAVLR